MKNGRLISMHQVFTERLIPWATSRRSIERVFKDGQLRTFTVGGKRKGSRPTHYTTSVWLEKYKQKITSKK